MATTDYTAPPAQPEMHQQMPQTDDETHTTDEVRGPPTKHGIIRCQNVKQCSCWEIFSVLVL